jgi:polysaccharide export outer membrane protein
MRPGSPLAALLAALLWLALAQAWAGEAPEGYRLGVGDRVRILVQGEDDLTVSVRIGESGTIPYPLLGELKAADLTPEGLKELVTSRLRGPYLVDPQVSVVVEEYRELFVMGQVNRPGSYAYLPGLTVRRAIALAGGYTDRASRSKVFAISESEPEKERRVGPDDEVRPGDTLVVKESFF